MGKIVILVILILYLDQQLSQLLSEDSSSFTLPINLSKDGYSLRGWYIDENLTDTFALSNIFDSSENSMNVGI